MSETKNEFIGVAIETPYEEWDPSISFLIDLLSIVTLKSIKLGCNNPEKKEAYEKEAKQIMNSLQRLFELELGKGIGVSWGRLIRAVQVNMLSNELIWSNETKARLGGEEQNHLLPLTHTLNGMRMRSGNAIINQLGGRKDLNLDRVNEELCKKFGFDFGKLFDE